jgi:1-acyl-sn-glycerol-3-phosphate acyltransferase
MRTPKPPRHFWLAHAVRATVGNIAIALFRVRLVGREKLPATGGFVLAGNHISYADPVLLWCRSPRPVHFMARANLWDSAFLGWALDSFWAFPIKRGAADREALQRASAYLKAGEPVGIFPEGTRKFKGNNEAHGGAAFLAIRNGVLVFPIGFSGTDLIKPPGARMFRFPKVVMAVGDPIDPASFAEGGRKERVEAMTDEVMRRIAEQVEQAREVAGR